ncbi:MAG: D-alanine--D-alanine ligase [Bacteriovoracaceae bacterium]|jgi:D-alanine-D-alanine ligase|nr:D-alanine--D-alanine ligase [Bacteriovoracaceae bacterium]
MPKNIIVFHGGGGSEHEISNISSQFLLKRLGPIENINIHTVLIKAPGVWEWGMHGECFLTCDGKLKASNTEIRADYAIPWIHGTPGETGEIQCLLEMMKVPYLGSSFEQSSLCFNKVSTKLYLNSRGIKNSNFTYLGSIEEFHKAEEFFHKSSGIIFVKASHQGSSVGCYKVESESQLKSSIEKAFELSSYVLCEEFINGRELEVAVYEYEGELHVTAPAEIHCPTGFYDYDQKYNSSSQTKTSTVAEGLSKKCIDEISQMAKQTFELFKLKDHVRVDFFVTDNETVYLGEPNTYPGLTEISLFPQMIESSGVGFTRWLTDRIETSIGRLE